MPVSLCDDINKKQGGGKNNRSRCSNCGFDWPHPGGKDKCSAVLHVSSMSKRKKKSLPKIRIQIKDKNKQMKEIEVVADTGAEVRYRQRCEYSI